MHCKWNWRFKLVQKSTPKINSSGLKVGISDEDVLNIKLNLTCGMCQSRLANKEYYIRYDYVLIEMWWYNYSN